MTKCRGSERVAVLFLALPFFIYADPEGRSRLDKSAITSVQEYTVSNIEKTLPSIPLSTWLAEITNANHTVEWNTDDCGEQTGNPTKDASRDFPMCVTATLRTVPGELIYVSFTVGTFGKGLIGEPKLLQIYIRKGETFTTLTTLAELKAHTISPDSKNLLKDPYQFVWAKEGAASGMTRFFYDLNNDGIRELFLASNALMGNGGGPFWIFAWRTGPYVYLGNICLAEGGFQFLNSKQHGYRDIKCYGHSNWSEGVITLYRFDGSQYLQTEQKTVNSTQFTKEIKPTAVAMEKSEQILNWPTSRVDKVDSPTIAKKLAIESLRSFGDDLSKYNLEKVDVTKGEKSWSVKIPRKESMKPHYTELRVELNGNTNLVPGK